MKNPKSVDEYIASAPEDVREKLKELRKVIKEVAPLAKERISYQIPGYFLNGTLVFFAAFKDHISLYPTSSYMEESIKEVANYRTGKGTLQFPLDEKLPLSLIKKIVAFRLKENMERGNK